MDQYGISSVTMDDIAKECRISKRTLYEQIPDKRTLVWYCVLHDREKKQQEARELINNAPTTLEALLSIYRQSRKSLTKASSIFFKDLHRLYPDLEQKCRAIHREQAQDFATILAQGVEEGMFRSDIDYPLAADIFIAQSSVIMKELGSTNDTSSVIKMMNTAFVIFLRGIATTKGLEIIDDFFKENNI